MTYNIDNPFRRRLIFIEGCDQTGKSTLARGLTYRSGFDCLAFSRGPINRIVMTQFFVNHVAEQNFPASRRAAVYLGFLPQIREILQSLIDADRAAVIYLNADFGVLQERMRKADHFILSERALEIQHGLFCAEIARHHPSLPTLHLNTSQGSAESTLFEAAKWMGVSLIDDCELFYPPSCLVVTPERGEVEGASR